MQCLIDPKKSSYSFVAIAGLHTFSILSKDNLQTNLLLVDIVCPELTPPENGYVESDGFTGFGSAVSYRCREGYKLRGEEKRSCQKTAIWLPSAPICESKWCS